MYSLCCHFYHCFTYFLHVRSGHRYDWQARCDWHTWHCIVSSARRHPQAMFPQRYYIISKQPLFTHNQIILAVRLTVGTKAGFRWGATSTQAGNLKQTREDGYVFLGVKVFKAASVMRPLFRMLERFRKQTSYSFISR